ncbi:MAG: enoyl-CoA hydratase/isomerase family protein, partial [Acidimicrobiales bacterium]
MSGELDREMVSYVLQDGVARITLDHPQRRNALSSELVGELGDRLHLAQGAEGVRVIVLTNSGSTFCAGADLKEAREPARAQPGRRRLADIFELMAMGPRPVVGRIAGHCFGGGVGLAAACDISVACDDAYFGFSEVRRGVAPAVISVVCLPKMRRCDA